jgi:hypothetical protein
MCNLATDEIDFEPMKSKSETLLAMKKIFTSEHFKKPFAAIATDGGTEFKGIFNKWLYNESIYHKVAEPYRQQQMSIENVNKQLGRILNGYMNQIKVETGQFFKEWADADVLNTIRTDLNKHRRIGEVDPYTEIYEAHNDRLNPRFILAILYIEKLKFH